ncbi:UNVERIFIED_CONTAM: hypothetical protein NCL1_24210 [Trichonephila clavipes]
MSMKFNIPIKSSIHYKSILIYNKNKQAFSFLRLHLSKGQDLLVAISGISRQIWKWSMELVAKSGNDIICRHILKSLFLKILIRTMEQNYEIIKKKTDISLTSSKIT